MTLYNGNRHPHTHTDKDTPSQTNTTTQAPRMSPMNELDSEGIPCKKKKKKRRQRGEGRCKGRERCWVAGVSELFLCGGTDWKLLHTTAASNPAAQLFRAGSVWRGATRAGLLVWKQINTGEPRTGTGSFPVTPNVCGPRMIFHVGGGSRVTASDHKGCGERSHHSPTLFFCLCLSSFSPLSWISSFF